MGIGTPAATAMPSAPEGQVEAGPPGFVVLGPEALGLSTTPTDLHLLPDARILVVAQHELSFGDGARWETFRGTSDQPNLLQHVAVTPTGEIFAGTLGGVSRIDLIAGGRWQFSPAVSFPTPAAEQLVGFAATFGDRWFWYGGGDPVVSWRPGQPATIAGLFGTVDRIFALDDNVFLSAASGRLFRLAPDGAVAEVAAAPGLVSEMVTCAAPFSPGVMLVGTVSMGLRLFDGENFRPFATSGWLGGARRITDLQPAGDGYFAAAVDTFGIVFFDRQGRIVQALDRSLDHRLARPLRLVYSPAGVLWALLNGGVARIAFPSQLSHYEPLLTSGLDYPLPLRHAGGLWVLGDGRAMRAVYDADRRLERFIDETPPGRYLFTLDDIDGRLFGTNDTGIFLHGEEGWTSILPGIVNARLVADPRSRERIHFVARGEYGTIEHTSEGFVAHRTPMPELRESYGSVTDAAGVAWFELGSGIVGQFDLRGAQPVMRILGASAGLIPDWVEIYVLEGVARFHLRHLHLRYDEARQQFVDDRQLIERWPQLANAGGRPLIDSLGRLWYTADGAPHAVDATSPGAPREIPLPAIDFFPTRYVVEDNGVAWMSDRRRLVRLDHRLPPPPDTPVRTLITSIIFPFGNRQIFTPESSLPPISYSDNSLVFHFAAPANPFHRPLTFEVLLEGADSRWVSTGTVGRAVFNGLKEGAYVFRVRPVQPDGSRGDEARTAFRIPPPWYRTRLAWLIYAFSAAGFVAAAAWFSAFLQRRENDRLERLVTIRTSELHETNRQLERQIAATSEKSAALAASEERYRTLNAELEQRVAARTSELSHSYQELQHRESLFRLVLEHAPVGIAWQRADLDEIVHFNPAFLHILGLDPEAPFDRERLFAMVHPEDSPRLIELSQRVERGAADMYQLEARFLRPDRNIVWASLSFAVVRQSDGQIVQHIGILEDISDRKTAEQELAATYKRLVSTSRVAGMAEVATGVLHNVGNVLTSLNVSANTLGDRVRESKATLLQRLSTLLDEHASDLGSFLTRDDRGRVIPEMVRALAQDAQQHRVFLLEEIAALQNGIDHIKEIVAMQQSYARMAGIIEVLDAPTLMDDAVRINESALQGRQIELVRDYHSVPPIAVEKGKVLQILVNLIRNAADACQDAGESHRRLVTVTVGPTENGRVAFSVRDNGIGIAPENLARIFSYGFTTRARGHGFGLHSSALAAVEMKGSLKAFSDGRGHGATFVLELPLAPASTDASFRERTFPEASHRRHDPGSSPRA